MFYGRFHLHKHRHNFERHRPDLVVLVLVGVRSCLVYSDVPNIEGYLNSANLGNIDAGYVLSWNGALRPNRVRNGRIVATQENNNYVITDDANFDASKSNALFGSSDTNQPKSLRALCLIRAYQA